MSKFQAWFRGRHPANQFILGFVVAVVAAALTPLIVVWFIGATTAEILRGDL